ncbi:DUF6941 family protein [Flaviaesturariibacter aridisoli]|uniref:Uncharacterized protein n=1 Tax=Flaviaesturariibacter aridisoli TaxID=2545761 RepID=A0A4V2WM99_9BACT|nr:hypothetical protein [Flaviaesturariibacter aridisoli]TCZ67209.1 hypothetical protein E0486_15955 [Flaviaesturariibacter aridisoli]
MEIEIFTLADHAQDVGGKLFISGTFDTINAPQFPLTYPAFSLAMRLRFSDKEAGTSRLLLKALDPSGKELIKTMEGDLPVPTPQAPATYSAINFTVNLYQIPFTVPGVYTFELYLDGEWKTGLKLNVVGRS